jgi:hypothetical protein
MGDRPVCRCPNDQRKVGNGGYETIKPVCGDQAPAGFQRIAERYEWMRTGKMKQPYCFEVNEGELFAFAGLWDRWKDSSGKVLGNLFDPDHRPKCRDLSRPRPDASHP